MLHLNDNIMIMMMIMVIIMIMMIPSAHKSHNELIQVSQTVMNGSTFDAFKLIGFFDGINNDVDADDDSRAANIFEQYA